MAAGLGQFQGAFASPDDRFDGVEDWTALSGMNPGDAHVDRSLGGGDPFATPEVISQRVSTTHTPAEISGAQHWSEVLNWRESPMPYLIVLVLLMLGFVQLQVAARLGRS